MAGGAYFRRGLLLEEYQLCLKFGGMFSGELVIGILRYFKILTLSIYISLKVLLYFNHGSLKFRCRTSIKNPLSLLERTPQNFLLLVSHIYFKRVSVLF